MEQSNTRVSDQVDIMMEKPAPKRGLQRIWGAMQYSLSGLAVCWKNEEAFRQESILFIILLPIVFLLPVSSTLKLILLLVNSLVLIIELINSAIEAVVDKSSPEFHDLAKQAKDMGSAAVFLTLVMAAAAWVAVLYRSFILP